MHPAMFKILLSIVSIITSFYGAVHYDIITFPTISAPTYTSTVAIRLPQPAPAFNQDELPVNDPHGTSNTPKVAVASGGPKDRSRCASGHFIGDEVYTFSGLTNGSSDVPPVFLGLTFSAASIGWPEFVLRLNFTMVATGLICGTALFFLFSFLFGRGLVNQALHNRVLESVGKKQQEFKETLDLQVTVLGNRYAQLYGTLTDRIWAEINHQDYTIRRLNEEVMLLKVVAAVQEKQERVIDDVRDWNADFRDLILDHDKTKTSISNQSRRINDLSINHGYTERSIADQIERTDGLRQDHENTKTIVTDHGRRIDGLNNLTEDYGATKTLVANHGEQIEGFKSLKTDHESTKTLVTNHNKHINDLNNLTEDYETIKTLVTDHDKRIDSLNNLTEDYEATKTLVADYGRQIDGLNSLKTDHESTKTLVADHDRQILDLNSLKTDHESTKDTVAALNLRVTAHEKIFKSDTVNGLKQQEQHTEAIETLRKANQAVMNDKTKLEKRVDDLETDHSQHVRQIGAIRTSQRNMEGYRDTDVRKIRSLENTRVQDVRNRAQDLARVETLELNRTQDLKTLENSRTEDLAKIQTLETNRLQDLENLENSRKEDFAKIQTLENKIEILETTLKAVLRKFQDLEPSHKSRHSSDNDGGNGPNEKPGGCDGGSTDAEDESNDAQPQPKPDSTSELSGKEASDADSSGSKHNSSGASENKKVPPGEVEQPGPNDNDEDDNDGDDDSKPLPPSDAIPLATPAEGNKVAVTSETVVSTGAAHAPYVEPVPVSGLPSFGLSSLFPRSSITVPITPSSNPSFSLSNPIQIGFHGESTQASPAFGFAAPSAFGSVAPPVLGATTQSSTAAAPSRGAPSTAQLPTVSATQSEIAQMSSVTAPSTPPPPHISTPSDGSAVLGLEALSGMTAPSTTASLGTAALPGVTAPSVVHGLPPASISAAAPSADGAVPQDQITRSSGDQQSSGEGEKVGEAKKENAQGEAEREEKEKEEEEEEDETSPKSPLHNPKKDPDSDTGAGPSGKPGDNNQSNDGDDDGSTSPSNQVSSTQQRSNTREDRPPSPNPGLQDGPSSSHNSGGTTLNQYDTSTGEINAKDRFTSLITDDGLEHEQKPIDESPPAAAYLPPPPLNAFEASAKIQAALTVLRQSEPTSQSTVNGASVLSGSQREAISTPMEGLSATNVPDDLSSAFDHFSWEPNAGTSEDMEALYGGDDRAYVVGSVEEAGEVHMAGTSENHCVYDSGEESSLTPMDIAVDTRQRGTGRHELQDTEMNETAHDPHGGIGGEEPRDSDMKDPSATQPLGDPLGMSFDEPPYMGMLTDENLDWNTITSTLFSPDMEVEQVPVRERPPHLGSSISGLGFVDAKPSTVDFGCPPDMTPMTRSYLSGFDIMDENNGPTGFPPHYSASNPPPSHLEDMDIVGEGSTQTRNGKIAKECNCCSGPRHEGVLPPVERDVTPSLSSDWPDRGGGYGNLLSVGSGGPHRFQEIFNKYVIHPNNDREYGDFDDFFNITRTPDGGFQFHTTDDTHSDSGTNCRSTSQRSSSGHGCHDQPTYTDTSESGYSCPLSCPLSCSIVPSDELQSNSLSTQSYGSEYFPARPRKDAYDLWEEQEGFAASSLLIAPSYGDEEAFAHSLFGSSDVPWTGVPSSVLPILEEDGTGYKVEPQSFNPFEASSSGAHFGELNTDLFDAYINPEAYIDTLEASSSVNRFDESNFDPALYNAQVALPFLTLPVAGSSSGTEMNDSSVEPVLQSTPLSVPLPTVPLIGVAVLEDDISSKSTVPTTPDEHWSACGEGSTTTTTSQSIQPLEQSSARTSVSDANIDNDTIMHTKLPRGQLHLIAPSVRGKRRKDGSRDNTVEEGGVKRLKTEEGEREECL